MMPVLSKAECWCCCVLARGHSCGDGDGKCLCPLDLLVHLFVIDTRVFFPLLLSCAGGRRRGGSLLAILHRPLLWARCIRCCLLLVRTRIVPRAMLLTTDLTRC